MSVTLEIPSDGARAFARASVTSGGVVRRLELR
jgi:hypothetical protein